MRQVTTLLTVVSLCTSIVASAHAADWARFRGPNGTGVATGAKTAVRWNSTENLKWQVELPGPGTSSPIVVGDRVFVTCYTGYGVDRGDPGAMEDLKRSLLCVKRADGRILWERSVASTTAEDPYRGFITEHGYASSTPASDGEHVFAFFGKSGVVAFDLDGSQLWQTSVGTSSGRMRWGSGASPLLHENLVIVNASEEDEAIYALDKKTGKEVWKAQAGGLASTWGTPVMVQLDGRSELVVAVPYEIWGMNPDNGKLIWYCEAINDNSMCSSAVTADGVVYAVGGRSGGGVAVRAGGKDDVTGSHVVWTGNQRGRIPTPLLYEGRLYWYNSGVMNCVDAKTGERVYQERLSAAREVAGADDNQRPQFGGGFGRGRRGGGQDYASPVAADGKIYVTTRRGDIHVVAAGAEFKLLASNRFSSAGADYSATPAIVDSQIFIRSSRTLYCVEAAAQ